MWKRTIKREPELESAIRIAGSPSALAKAIGVKLPSVCCWNRVPAQRVLQIEKALGISRHELRPDLYPLDAASSDQVAA